MIEKVVIVEAFKLNEVHDGQYHYIGQRAYYTHLWHTLITGKWRLETIVPFFAKNNGDCYKFDAPHEYMSMTTPAFKSWLGERQTSETKERYIRMIENSSSL